MLASTGGPHDIATSGPDRPHSGNANLAVWELSRQFLQGNPDSALNRDARHTGRVRTDSPPDVLGSVSPAAYDERIVGYHFSHVRYPHV